MAGRCREADCSFYGQRLICYACLGDDWYLKAQDFFETQARCGLHDMEHKRDIHKETPEVLACTGCKKPLGTFTDIRSPAGAPWCGSCAKWWVDPDYRNEAGR